MTGTELPAAHADFLRQVEAQLSDIDPEDRAVLIADLKEQLTDMSPAELDARLGTPEAFVEEYRRSSGYLADGSEPQTSTGMSMAHVISILMLPFGVLILFSFGGQLILGPFVLAIEWILARVSPRPLRIVWSLLAGVLVGEIVVVVMDAYLFPLNSFLVAITWTLIAGPIAILIYSTTAGKVR